MVAKQEDTIAALTARLDRLEATQWAIVEVVWPDAVANAKVEAFVTVLFEQLAAMPQSPGQLTLDQLNRAKRLFAGRMVDLQENGHPDDPIDWIRILVGALKQAGSH